MTVPVATLAEARPAPPVLLLPPKPPGPERPANPEDTCVFWYVTPPQKPTAAKSTAASTTQMTVFMRTAFLSFVDLLIPERLDGVHA